MVDSTEEKYLTMREAELLITAGASAESNRFEAHRREHELQGESLDLLIHADKAQQDAHNLSHDRAHDSHGEKHQAEDEAVKTALASVDRERNIHAIAHDKEHLGHKEIHDEEQRAVRTALDAVGRERDIHAAAHEREHQFSQVAIQKAEEANDKRFALVNGTRDQMNDIIRTLATKESVDTLTLDKTRRWEELRIELDRRFNEQRLSITNLEKGDVKAEGRGLGQGATIAAIIGTVGFVGSLLGIIIVFANLITSSQV